MDRPPLNIRAIETRYAGHRFRSRLEARWAVFFDELAISWEYEPQGFEINGTRYLPDFWLPRQRCFYEVKPTAILADYRTRLEALATGVEERVVLASGFIPGPKWEPNCADLANDDFFMETFYRDGWDNYQAWCRCQICGEIDIQFMGYAGRNCECLPGDKAPAYDDYFIREAYTAARSARFEHGESGR